MKKTSLALFLACSSAAATVVACSDDAGSSPAPVDGGGGGGDASTDAGSGVDAAPATEERTVASGDVSLHVKVVGGGTGPVILAVNGGPGFSHHYMAAFTAFASANVRVVLYDQRGTGTSTAPADSSKYAFADQSADIEAIRGALGVESLHVVGHSWGGGIALHYASTLPARVASLALVDNVPPTRTSFLAGRARFDQRIAALQGEGKIPNPVPGPSGDDCKPVLQATNPAYFADPSLPMPPPLAQTSCHSGTQSYAITAALLPAFDFGPGLAGFAKPTLVLFGAGDAYGLEWQTETATALVGAQPVVTTVTAAGHYPWLEKSDESMTALAAHFQRAGIAR